MTVYLMDFLQKALCIYTVYLYVALANPIYENIRQVCALERTRAE
jgi:hypothetical protein